MLARALILSAATVVALGVAGPARADNRDNNHHSYDQRGHARDWHRDDHRPGGYHPWVYAPPPPIAYAPAPPAYYGAPPPVYYAPSPGLNFSFSIP